MRVTRMLSPIALAAVAALAATACQSTTVDDEVPSDYSIEQMDRDDMPAEVQEIYDRGHIMVGTLLSREPMGGRDEMTGRVVGFDAEIARIVAQRIFGDVGEGDNLFFIEPLAHLREESLESGTVDMLVASYTITEERKESVDFAGPYYVDGQSILSTTEDSFEGVDELAGQDVCMLENTTSLDNIEERSPDADIHTTTEDWSECFAGLQTGIYDAVSTDGILLHGFALTDPDEYHVSDETFSDEPYGVGVPKDSEGFREFVNDTLEIAYENGDWEAAFERTLGAADVQIPDSPPDLDRY